MDEPTTINTLQTEMNEPQPTITICHTSILREKTTSTEQQEQQPEEDRASRLRASKWRESVCEWVKLKKTPISKPNRSKQSNDNGQ